MVPEMCATKNGSYTSAEIVVEENNHFCITLPRRSRCSEHFVFQLSRRYGLLRPCVKLPLSQNKRDRNIMIAFVSL